MGGDARNEPSAHMSIEPWNPARNIRPKNEGQFAKENARCKADFMEAETQFKWQHIASIEIGYKGYLLGQTAGRRNRRAKEDSKGKTHDACGSHHAS